MDALPIGRIALVPLQGAPGRVAHGPRADTAPIPFSGVDHARSQERQAPAHDVGALDDGWQGFHRAGWGAKTQWYRNILSDARVTVQSSGKPYGAIARRVTHDDELARLYEVIRARVRFGGSTWILGVCRTLCRISSQRKTGCASCGWTLWTSFRSPESGQIWCVSGPR